LKEITHGLYFQNMRLFKANGDWRYEGAIHERLRPKGGLSYTPTFDGLPGERLYTLHDGTGRRSLEDDVFVMEKELEKDPNSTRWHFHLAKAQKAIPGHQNQAIYHFARRIALGRNDLNLEEGYMSRIYVARIILDQYLGGRLSDELRAMVIQQELVPGPTIGIEDIIAILDKARHDLGYRYEAWCELSTLYWYQSHDAENCYRISHEGILVGNMGSVRQQTLFATDQPKYCLHVRRCVCGYHTQHFRESLESCSKVDAELPRVLEEAGWERMYRGAVQEYIPQLRAIGVVV
jgi:hypothetical protein